jgi:hypothetical protein
MRVSVAAPLLWLFCTSLLAQTCQDIGGQWLVEDNTTIIYNIAGQLTTNQTSGTGPLTIDQTGCNIHFISEAVNPVDGSIIQVPRDGTVTGNNVTYSGQAGVIIPGASYSVNLLQGNGVIDNNVITITNTGAVVASVMGIPITVTIAGVSRFTRPPRPWTVMVYLDGDNDLETYALDDFMEMSQVDNTNVNIVVQFDRGGNKTNYGGWTTAKRFLVTRGMTPTAANALEDIGEANMGAMETLRDFIVWARSTYPATNYALILWNHGDGWRFAPEGRSPMVKGICTDHGDQLEMAELQQALREATGNGTNPIQVVNMDACLMAGLEVVWSLKDYALYFSGSPELVPSDGSEYQDILSPAHLSAATTPQAWCQYTVTAYQARYDGWDSQQCYVACRLSAAEAVATNVSALATLLINDMALERPHISAAWSNSRRYSDDPSYVDVYRSFVDLHDFCSNLRQRTPNQAISNQCALVMSTLANDLVLSHWADAQYGGTTAGQRCVWVYFPPSVAEAGWPNYNGGFLPFLSPASQHWDEFLNDYFATTVSAPVRFAASVVSNGVFRVTLTGPAGSNCVIKTSSDLVNWAPLCTNAFPAGGSIFFADPGIATRPRTFYRVASE